ncbi:MAG: allophanate hydrolase subunit 1 [Oscillochloris sp.]|nr:allophanate hydrolase subunit 1 [Oscillochloris sp.]
MLLNWSVHPFGEAALLAEAHGDQKLANRAALAAAAALEADPPPGMRAVVPAIASLLVIVAPEQADFAALEQQILALLKAGPSADEQPTRIVPIAINFDRDSAPDLPSAAAGLGCIPTT